MNTTDTTTTVNAKPNCFECGSVIDGKLIEIHGSPFHLACWTCFKCEKQLGEVYFPMVGETDSYYDKKGVCDDCYHSAPKCGGCLMPVVSDKCLNALNKKWHKVIAHSETRIPHVTFLFEIIL